MADNGGQSDTSELPSSEHGQVNVDCQNEVNVEKGVSETSGVEKQQVGVAFVGNIQNGNLAEILNPDKAANSVLEFLENNGNQNEGDEDDDGDAHNRSHESIESQRTILEADDFASYLAHDDSEVVDDFKDEDVDFDGDDGGVYLSKLMKSGSNPYMLDFTSGLYADNDIDGDGYDNSDDTLSDHEEDGHQTAEKDLNFSKTSSWVRQTVGIHSPVTKPEQEEVDEEFESPPRNLREEINNNVAKFSRVPPLSPGLFSPSGIPPNFSNHSDPSSPSGLVPAGLSRYNIQKNSTPPSSPLTFNHQTVLQSSHTFPNSAPGSPLSQTLPYGFDPDSQSSPKFRRSSQENSHDHEQNGGYIGHQDSAFMYDTSQAFSLHVATSNNQGGINYDNHKRPKILPQETSFGHLVSFSSSMENLPKGHSPDYGLAYSPHTSDILASYVRDGTPLQRGKSLPNIVANIDFGITHELCKNCGFSRNDYLFKIRLLQTQLEKAEKELKKKEKQWAADLGELRKDNDRQQKIISQSLTLGPEAKIEATMQHEITRLTSENLDLRESIDKQSDQIRKLKKMLKAYARKLKDGEGAELAAELENEENAATTDSMATVIHKERSYMGMLEYKKDDEPALIKNLILDLKPKVAAGLIPGLPAYILFMCVRHTDYINDDDKIKTLLTSTINGIKKVVKRHSDDLERVTMWLANTCRLLHTLKQYSGEKQFQTENTPKQNEQSLRNFDLSEYRQVFSDLAVWNYQALIKLMEELIQPNIVPAILEHEAIAGLTASKPSGLRGRSSSNAREMEEGRDSQHALDALMRTLNSYMRIVKQHAVDPELVKQIFRQLFYFLCAGALNNLLLRKDMCNWSKGMQIRYNLSHLEQWLRDNSLHEFGAQAALEPIIQASQLLQARKTDSDVDSICEMCSKLSTAQIVKILNIYTPVDEFEERVPITFIRKIQAKLKQREEDGTTSTTLLMDTKYSYPVTFPFNPSSVTLETISVPETLHLGFLIRH